MNKEKSIAKGIDATQIQTKSIDASKLEAHPDYKMFISSERDQKEAHDKLHAMLDEDEWENAIVAKVKKMYHEPVEVDVYHRNYENIGFPTTSIFVTQRNAVSIEVSEFRYQRDELVAVRGNVFLYEIEKMKEALK